MPKLAANLTMLFNEVPFLDRFERAASAGFGGVEYLFPYDYDTKVLRNALDHHGLVQVLHNLPAGDWAVGDRGIGCLPDRVEEFQSGVGQAIEYATALGCSRVNCLAGIRPPDLDPRLAREVFVRNLKFAAPRFQSAGVALLIEPINTQDIPGFFLESTSQAIDIMDAVASDNLHLQCDIYHMQMMSEPLEPTIGRLLPRIAHVQVADVPGRHEPGTGVIDYPSLLSALDRAGYDGWVGCEYKPKTSTDAGLGWARPYLSK